MLLGVSKEHEVLRRLREAAVAADRCQGSPAREVDGKSGTGPIPMSFRGNKRLLIERVLETKLQLEASTAGFTP
jgi:hypothetical protein